MPSTGAQRSPVLWVSRGFGLLTLYAIAGSGCSDQQPFECGNFSPKVRGLDARRMSDAGAWRLRKSEIVYKG